VASDYEAPRHVELGLAKQSRRLTHSSKVPYDNYDHVGVTLANGLCVQHSHIYCHVRHVELPGFPRQPPEFLTDLAAIRFTLAGAVDQIKGFPNIHISI